MILGVVLVSMLYACVFFIAEYCYQHKKIPGFVTRKIAHMGAGIVSALLPFFISREAVIILGVCATGVMVWSRRTFFLKSITLADTKSLGEILFPIGLLASVVIFWHLDPMAFQVGALTLGLADGFAGMAGRWKPWGTVSFFGNTKTLLGSFVFFCTSSSIFLCVIIATHSFFPLDLLAPVLVAAGISTAAEFLFGGGWDNVSVPLAAGYAYLFFVI